MSISSYVTYSVKDVSQHLLGWDRLSPAAVTSTKASGIKPELPQAQDKNARPHAQRAAAQSVPSQRGRRPAEQDAELLLPCPGLVVAPCRAGLAAQSHGGCQGGAAGAKPQPRCHQQ